MFVHIPAYKYTYAYEYIYMYINMHTDPLGLSKNGDEAVFARRRAVELKHGRVAMLAVTVC
jgi:hypothetical protein